jgi:hypothetical protein
MKITISGWSTKPRPAQPADLHRRHLRSGRQRRSHQPAQHHPPHPWPGVVTTIRVSSTVGLAPRRKGARRRRHFHHYARRGPDRCGHGPRCRRVRRERRTLRQPVVDTRGDRHIDHEAASHAADPNQAAQATQQTSTRHAHPFGHSCRINDSLLLLRCADMRSPTRRCRVRRRGWGRDRPTRRLHRSPG